MPEKHFPSLVAQQIVDDLKAYSESLSIDEVFYGDQDKIGKKVVVCVEPGEMKRDLAGVPDQTENTFEVMILLYYSGIQEQESARKTCDEIAEGIMEHLHKDLRRDGLVYYGFVTSLESGYAARRNTLLFANRITWNGLSKTGLQPL